jgi:TetR/AcrR family transcriptional regulator, fatty acid metabolism regulator protein
MENTMPTASKRQRILDAAVAVMSRKGKDSTISEIARGAGVTDSVLYHYFENKDDLLFSAIGEYLKIAIHMLEEHLQGICDPMSRLRKLIWFQLYYHDVNPHYAYFTIFKCRSKINFFRHPAFEYFRYWARVLRGIIEDGQKSGAFSADLNTYVFRDTVLGLLDIENIQFFTGNHPEQAQEDLDPIMNLLHPVLTTSKPLIADKQQRILYAAESIFSNEGYDKATISKIAKAAEVAEGSIYGYFKNKEDLLYTMLQQRLKEHVESLSELFQITAPLRKLRRFVRYHFSLYLNQPDFAKVFVVNGVFNYEFYRTHAHRHFREYLEQVNSILEEGKAAGCIRKSVVNRVFMNLLMGAFSYMVLRWLFIGESSKADKTSEINTVVENLTLMVADTTPNG